MMKEIKKQLLSTIKEYEIEKKDAIDRFEELTQFLKSEEKKWFDEHEYICTWGDFGWALSPEIELVFYEEIPRTQAEADQRMENRLVPDDMKKIFDGIVNCEYGNQELKEEAVRAYQGELYHSCCLNLFALIDSWIINAQDISKNRKSGGTKAVAKLDDCLKPEEQTWCALILETCKKALLIFFRDTEHFQDDDNTMISRHQLMHGMWAKRKINKSDCDRLFLLYENLLFLIGYDVVKR